MALQPTEWALSLARDRKRSSTKASGNQWKSRLSLSVAPALRGIGGFPTPTPRGDRKVASPRVITSFCRRGSPDGAVARDGNGFGGWRAAGLVDDPIADARSFWPRTRRSPRSFSRPVPDRRQVRCLHPFPAPAPGDHGRLEYARGQEGSFHGVGGAARDEKVFDVEAEIAECRVGRAAGDVVFESIGGRSALLGVGELADVAVSQHQDRSFQTVHVFHQEYMGFVDLSRVQLARSILDPAQRLIGQRDGPSALFAGAPHFVSGQALHGADSGLAAAPPFDVGLEYLQGVKAVPLDHVKADDEGPVHGLAQGMFPVGIPPHDGKCRSGPERNVLRPGCFVHPGRIVPAVGEVLVVEDRDGPSRFADDAGDLFEEIAPRQHLLAQFRPRVVAVFPDQQNRIHRQFLSAQGQRRPDALVQRDVELVCDLAADVVLVNLVDVQRGDFGPGWNHALVGGKSAQELVDDDPGMAVGKEGGHDGGDPERPRGVAGFRRCRD